MRTHVVGSAHGSAVIDNRNAACIPVVAPGINTSIVPLSGILPLPFMRQAFARPFCVGACILERNPGHGLVCPSLRIVPILPVLEEIQSIGRMVVSCVQKLLKLFVGHRVLVHIKSSDMVPVLVIA